MTRQLIVNADDYGRSAGVSRGILYAHRHGIVTSTTAMVNVDDVQHHLAEAIECPALGIGLHCVFCSWRPVLPPEEVPGLVDDQGFFLDQHVFWARAEEIPLLQLEAELNAQFERFTALAGRAPDHLDCHQLVHVHPRLFEVYVDLAARRHVPVRVPFSAATDWETHLALGPFLQGSSPDQLLAMMSEDMTLLCARGLAHPDHSLTTFFGRRALTPDHLVHLLDTLPDGVSELMCHPGYADAALGRSGYRAEREIELRLLIDPQIRDRITALGIELVTFSVLQQ